MKTVRLLKTLVVAYSTGRFSKPVYHLEYVGFEGPRLGDTESINDFHGVALHPLRKIAAEIAAKNQATVEEEFYYTL